jgi:hypothetical protein
MSRIDNKTCASLPKSDVNTSGSKMLGAMLVVLLAVGFGCGRSPTYKTKDGEVTVNQKNGQATIEGNTKEGKFKVSSGEQGVALPDDFPKDVPIYKGATVKTAMQTKDMVMVHFRVPTASFAEVAKYYQDELKGQGWEIEATVNLGEASTVSAKKEKRQCSVTATKDDKGTMAQVVISKQGS